MFCLLIVASLAGAQAPQQSFSLYINESLLGVNRYEESAEGAVHSVTDLNAAGKQVKSDLTAQFKKGKLASYKLSVNAAGQESDVSFDGVKVRTNSGGKETVRDFKGGFDAVFANMHPQVARSLLTAVKQDSQSQQTIRVLIMDAGIALPCTVVARAPQVVELEKGKAPIRRLNVQMAGIPLELAYSTDGRVAGISVPTQRFVGTLAGFEGVFVDPVAKYKELSQPTLKTRTEGGIKVPMRDGVELVHDMVRPDAEGKYPVILERTPYGKAGPMMSGEFYAKRGYIFIAQDCRGREASSGVWDPFVHERQDGADTIEWIAKQPWCDGNVGMIGGSYLGYVQWAAAVEHPSSLKCIVPQVSPPDAFTNLPYDNGIPMLWPGLWWANLVSDKQTHLERARAPLPNPDALIKLPLSKLDEQVLGYSVPFWKLWLDRDSMAKWQGFDTLKDVGRVSIPSLSISGWWDGDEIGTQLIWQARRDAGVKNQWLVYGPWTHAFDTSTKVGDMEYGQDSLLELDSLYLRWFDTWLKAREVGFGKVPKVQAFVTGENKWHELADWPDGTASKPVTFYLAGQGKSNGLSGHGLLSSVVSKGSPDRYTYNPSRVIVPEEMKNVDPTNADSGDLKFKPRARASDLLVYRTEKLQRATTLAGPIVLDLYFSTSAKDTDFFAFLLDENEKGDLHYVCQPGKVRASYLDSLDKRTLVTPGRVYHAQIKLWDTAHCFLPGHRIALAIKSHMFPEYARNLNTGEPDKDATRVVIAEQTIYRDAEHPSALKAQMLITDEPARQGTDQPK